MKRLNKTLNDYSSRLEAFGFNKETDKITLLTKLRDCDVSKGKYTRFLLECYLDKTIRDEDLSGGVESTVGKTISLFHKNKNKLSEEDRSLNRYKTVGALWKNVKQFEKEKSAHELKKEHRDKINKETKFIVNSDYKVLSPLTKEAAQFWGRGTRWCTSAKENNAFDQYNNKAPLFIVIFPNGSKFQLWRNDNNFEAMDEADDGIDNDLTKDNWEWFKSLYDILPLHYIPQEELTYEKCYNEMEKDGWLLEFVLEKFKTYELCLQAVKNYGHALNSVPESLKTYDLCMGAVKDDGGALRFVPESLKDYNLYLEAVKSNGHALKYIQGSLINHNLCLEAIKSNGHAFNYVPDKFKTYNLFLEFVKDYGCNLTLVPNKLKTKEMCMEAVRNRACLRLIPKKLRTYDLCLESIKNYDGLALLYIPEKLIDYNLCMKSVKQISLSLKYVPENILDYNLCLVAVKKDGVVLEYVPDKFKDYNLCLEAVKKDGGALRFVPEKFKNEELFNIAINRTTIDFIKENLIKEKEEFMGKK